MRVILAMALVVGVGAGAHAQQGRPKGPIQIPPRYNIAYRDKAYPQTSPKETLESVLDAVEKSEASYIVAHLLEPAFVDARVAERARGAAPAVQARLLDLRDYQQRNLDRITPESRIPTAPEEFRHRVQADARTAGFKQLVRDVQEKLIEDPSTIKEFRRFRAQGVFPDAKAAGETAKVGAEDVKNRFLFFKKIGNRWYLENRQEEAAPAAMPPEKKKE